MIKSSFKKQIRSKEEIELMLEATFAKSEIGRNQVSDLHQCILLFLIETLKIPNKVLRYERPQLFRAGSTDERTKLVTPPLSPSQSALSMTPGCQDLSKLKPPTYLRSFSPLRDSFNTKTSRLGVGAPKALSSFSRTKSSNEQNQTVEIRKIEQQQGSFDRNHLTICTPEQRQKDTVDSPMLTVDSNRHLRQMSGFGALPNGSSRYQATVLTPSASPRAEAIRKDSSFQIGRASPTPDERQQVFHKGEMYRLIDAYKLKPYYYELRGQQLYVYRKEGEQTHKDMYFLGGGVFIRKQSDIKAQKLQKIIYSFSLIFPTKRREFFLLDKTENEIWIEQLKLSIGHSSLDQFYQVGNKIGNGKFGTVKAAKHISSGTPSAVKVIKKNAMNKEDQEATKTEIEILKLCHHPHVVRLYDIFQNETTINLVQELLEGGDFFTYLEQKKFKLKQDMARNIAHQLATAIFYLHSYGVIHRDIKPENIMLSKKIKKQDKDSIPDVKIMDFGLSKIIGPKEKATEPYGTLSYVAPEVLDQKPYTSQVDIFSFGVVVYLMLSGTLPFDDEDDHITAKKTLKEEPSYGKRFSGVSEEAIKFIKQLLEKKPEKRLTIQNVLEHPWLTKDCAELREKRRTINDLKRFQAFASAN